MPPLAKKHKYVEMDAGNEKSVKIYTGDCTTILKSLGTRSVDCVVTDPPYNVGIDYHGGDGDKKSNYAEWCKVWFTELRRVCRGPIAISVGQSNLSVWATIAPPDWWLAWWKPGAMGRCTVGFNNWEPIALYGKTRKSVCDVVRACIKPDPDLKGHPCPKPLEWGTKQLEMLCPDAGTVLDPFAGTGTVGVAAVGKFNSILIEQVPNYVDIIKQRIIGAVCRLDQS